MKKLFFCLSILMLFSCSDSSFDELQIEDVNNTFDGKGGDVVYETIELSTGSNAEEEIRTSLSRVNEVGNYWD